MLGDFCSITKTHDELSLIVEEGMEPKGSKIENDWRMLKVLGALEFSLTGIMSSLTAPLAAQKVSVFSLSTFDTDYLFVKNGNLERAVEVLRKAGFMVNVES